LPASHCIAEVGFRQKVPSSSANSPFGDETDARFALWFAGRTSLSRILKPFVFLLAAIYLLADAVFWSVAKPITRQLSDRRIFASLRAWIVSLRPYPTLALFLVPVIVLEPVKPVAAYLTAMGHIIGGLSVLAAGEILKLVLIERLFSISRDKLMSIAAFAWCYDKFHQARTWVKSLEAWQLMRRLSVTSKYAVRGYLREMRLARKLERLSWQSR
jgi:hypothetical protein